MKKVLLRMDDGLYGMVREKKPEGFSMNTFMCNMIASGLLHDPREDNSVPERLYGVPIMPETVKLPISPYGGIEWTAATEVDYSDEYRQ